MRLKIAGAAAGLTTFMVVAMAAIAGAQTGPTFDPASEATSVFSDNWSLVLDMVKAMAPIAIGAGLVVLAIRKVTKALRRGSAPGV